MSDNLDKRPTLLNPERARLGDRQAEREGKNSDDLAKHCLYGRARFEKKFERSRELDYFTGVVEAVIAAGTLTTDALFYMTSVHRKARSNPSKPLSQVPTKDL